MNGLEIHARGCLAWDEIQLSAERFVELTQGWVPPQLAEGKVLDAGEVLLAAACAAEDPVALRLFERRYLAPVRRVALARLHAGADVDDVMQQARIALLLPQDREGVVSIPLLRYAGRGRLAGLVRTVVLRACSKARGRSLLVGGEDELNAVVGVVEAALHGTIANELGAGRQTTREAVKAAWSAMDADARLLLQLHHIKGMPVRKLGTLYGVHAATVARRVAAARLNLARDIRAALQALDPERAKAIRMGFESRLSLSFMEIVPGTSSDGAVET